VAAGRTGCQIVGFYIYLCYTYLSQVSAGRCARTSATSEETWLIPQTYVEVAIKTCAKCHDPLPFSQFHHNRSRADGYHHTCKSCRSQTWKEDYAENKTQILQREHAYHAKVRLERPQHERVRRQRKHKRHYAKYREKILAKNAAYNATHPESVKKRAGTWAKSHPEQTQAFCASRRARVANATIVESISLEVLAVRDNWTCHICKKKVTRKTWSHDHLIPLSKGGNHTYLNVALCHQRCNSRMGVGRLPAQLRLLA
jgi:5-methylcytosine-specific restriction endonuclease McrA